MDNQSEMEVSQQEMVLDDEDKDEIKLNNFDESAMMSDLDKLKIKLVLCHVLKAGHKFTELINNFEISEFLTNKKQIRLCELIGKIKEIGFPIDQNMVYYFSPEAEMYVYCGIDPIPEDIVIDQEDYWEKKQLRIKCKESPISYIHQTMSEEANELIAKNKDQQPPVKETNSKSRRNNEKKIGFIIEKVVHWRKLYNGVQDETGQIKKYSLDDAANKVGIPKKSLDDYLLQIRFGRKYGFNFNEYKNDKVGQLRQFVRKHKQQNDKPKKRNKKDKNKTEQNSQSNF